MIISFSGNSGSGKSTVAKKVSEKFGYEHYYMGQILRDLAKKKNMTLVELLKSGEKDETVDKYVDDFLVNLSKNKKDFVIESRTAWYLIPQSLKIYLKVDKLEGAKRIFSHLQGKNQRNEDRKLTTLEDVLKSNERRRATDNRRYKKYYGIDINDMENYDFVLDTTDIGVEEVFKRTMEFIKSKLNK